MPQHHAVFIKHLLNFFKKVRQCCGDCTDWKVSFSSGKFHLSADWDGSGRSAPVEGSRSGQVSHAEGSSYKASTTENVKHKSPAKYERDRRRFRNRKRRMMSEIPPRFQRHNNPESRNQEPPPIKSIHEQKGHSAAIDVSTPSTEPSAVEINASSPEHSSVETPATPETPDSKIGTASSSACSQDVIKPPWFDGCHSGTLELLCTIEPPGPPSVPPFVPALTPASEFTSESAELGRDVHDGDCDGCLGTFDWSCLKECTRCSLSFYCSRDCQTKDYWIHRPTCDDAFFATTEPD